MLTLSLSLAIAPVLTDFTVGPPGSGADFEDIQSAVDASSGAPDRIFVLPGTYFFSSITIDKSIDLLGSGPEQTLLSPSLDSETLAALPHITIENLDADERVRLVGFSCVGVPFLVSELSAANVIVENCEGPVTLAELELGGSGQVGIEPATEIVRIANSNRVVMDRCSVEAYASTALSPDGGLEGTTGLRVNSSSVWVNDSRVLGATGNPDASITQAGTLLFAGQGGPGLVASDSAVVLGGVELLGGPGEAGGVVFAPPIAGAGGVAARLENNSFLQIAGGSWSSLSGGSGALNEAADPPIGAGASGVDVRGGSSVQFGIGVTVEGGFDGLGMNQAPPVIDDCTDCGSPGISFYLTAMRCSGTRFEPGESFTLQVQSVPDSIVAIYSDNQTVAPLQLPGFLGSALIAPAASEALIPVLTDAIGFASKQVQVPQLAFPGARRYLQAASLSASQVDSISPPAFATVGF